MSLYKNWEETIVGVESPPDASLMLLTSQQGYSRWVLRNSFASCRLLMRCTKGIIAFKIPVFYGANCHFYFTLESTAARKVLTENSGITMFCIHQTGNTSWSCQI